MMVRTVYVLLTILGLLVCPIKCMSQERSVVDGVASAGGCSGCSPNCPSSNEKGDSAQPTPEEPAERGHVGACRGFLGQSPKRPVIEPQRVLTLSAVTLGPAVDAPLARFVDNRPDRSVPCPVSGRERCIELRSLLL